MSIVSDNIKALKEFQQDGINVNDFGPVDTAIDNAIKVFELINTYAEHHKLAISCGSEYISQSDSGIDDALELTMQIFDYVFLDEGYGDEEVAT